jgi:hypothetical protein
VDYNELCKYILDLDTNVRFAGVCDETGEIRSGGQREDLDPDHLLLVTTEVESEHTNLIDGILDRLT